MRFHLLWLVAVRALASLCVALVLLLRDVFVFLFRVSLFRVCCCSVFFLVVVWCYCWFVAVPCRALLLVCWLLLLKLFGFICCCLLSCVDVYAMD